MWRKSLHQTPRQALFERLVDLKMIGFDTRNGSIFLFCIAPLTSSALSIDFICMRLVLANHL